MRWASGIAVRAGVASLVTSVGCYTGASSDGEDNGDGNDDTAGTGAEIGASTTGEPLPEDAEDEIAVAGLRRLSVVEYQQTIADLLGIDAEAAKELLPIDTLTPFDNDYTIQIASEPLIKGLEVIAGDLATTIVETEALRTAIVPCAPTGPDDDACFREFITTFGRRALRRPLTATEIDTYASLLSYAALADDFWFGVHAGLRMFLQHPELVYRVEIGEPVPDHPELRRLGDFELAARLSYFTIGSTTPDWLLDAAEQGMLADGDGVTTAAQTLLADDRARARIDRFHALWLRYEQLSAEGIYGNMRDESDALVERIVFDDRTRWTDMLEATETWVTAELAEHYGLPAPNGAAGWVPYGDSGRMGLLSHGSFLSVGAKFGDTSPTQRGLLVRTALFCQEIPKPPDDLMVNVDEPPMGADPDACKIDQYYMWQEPACQACHTLMDPLGFGLEAYDASGAFRTAQADRPECAITGDGEFYGGPNPSPGGAVAFNGPAALATIAVESGEVEACVAKQLYRFAVGRLVLDEHDEALLERLVTESGGVGELEMLGFVEGYVSSDAFRYRREEEGQ